MHLLLRIEEVTKTKRRLCFDSEEDFIVSVYDLKGMNFPTEGPVEDSIYDALYKKIVLKGKKKVLELLTDSDRTRKSIKDKLKLQGYTSDMISDIMDYIDKYNYLDDRRLAENYVDYHKESMSKLQLREKLIAKGVPDEIIQDVLSDLKIDNSALIEQVLRKRCNNDFDRLKDNSYKEKQIRYLLSKGYNYSEVKKIVNKYLRVD